MYVIDKLSVCVNSNLGTFYWIVFQLENDADFLWRLSKATYFMSQLEAVRDKNKQKVLVYQALDFASRALELDDCNANVHKWYIL